MSSSGEVVVELAAGSVGGRVDKTAFTPSHFGICVSDLGRSMRFYCEGIGFEKAETHEVTNIYERSLEMSGHIVGTAQFIKKPGMTIELLHYDSPTAQGRPATQRNQLGLTHLSFTVDDVDAKAAELVQFGGAVLKDTRVGANEPSAVQIIFLADPDGTRVELYGPGGSQ
jgi:lactoylglutathione lyase